MKLDRHVEGETLRGLLGFTAVGAEPAQSSALATTFMKSVRSVMTRSSVCVIGVYVAEVPASSR
jgi:hypothetical protein